MRTQRPDFSLEQTLLLAGDGPVAGIDEAGRGPLAGPVVAGCVILPQAAAWVAELHDSKQLSAVQRTALFEQIIATAACGIGEASAAEIDALNIHHATLLAMQRAFAAMHAANAGLQCGHVLVDGKFAPSLACPATAVVKGDSRSLSIAAASILAKVYRDRLMQAAHESYPMYGWSRNAGYPTAAHLAALAAHGVTALHRRSFAPVRAILAAS
jgi:ribonuclease HII